MKFLLANQEHGKLPSLLFDKKDDFITCSKNRSLLPSQIVCLYVSKYSNQFSLILIKFKKPIMKVFLLISTIQLTFIEYDEYTLV